jgi:uncharacterized protein (DUF1330 family)
MLFQSNLQQEENKMSAFVIADITVNDPERYEEYKKLAPPAIAAYGGKYLARGGKSEKLEGNWEPDRVVILKFESIEKAKEWIDSPEYNEARALRHKTASSNMIVVEAL